MTVSKEQWKATEESPDLLRRLVAVGRALAEKRDQTDIFRTLRDFIAEFVGFDTFLVTYLEPETQMRRCVYCWGDGVERPTSLFEPLPINDSPMSRALVTGQPVVCDDLPSELLPDTPFFNVGSDRDPRETRAYLIVPIGAGGRVVGSIQLQSYAPNRYDLSDAVPIAAVAGHAAAALENARLLDAAAAARRRAERAAAREATLNRVGALLYSTLDPSEVFSTATRALRAVFGAHRATFLTLSEGERVLRAEYEDRRVNARPLQGHLVDVDRIPADAFDRLRSGEALAIADVEAASADASAAAIFRYSGDRAGLCIPIVENAVLAGVLFVGDSQPREWEVEEIALARGVADQVAVALRQAELFLMAARSREEWERTFEAMADAVALVDPADRLSRANRAFWSSARVDKSAIGRPLAEVLHGGDEDAVADCEICNARLAQREGTFVVSRPSRRSEFGRHFEIKLNRVESAGGRYVGMVQVIRDVTALRSAEAALASRQAILDSVLSSTTDAIALLDPSGEIRWLNVTAERLAGDGSDRLRGSHVAVFLGVEDLDELDSVLARVRAGELVQLERSLPREGGLLLECALAPVREEERITGIVVTARDVTERRASMDRAQEGEKLRALGQLAAGVAHDFNNLLASILGHAQLLGRIPMINEVPSSARKLAAIERAARDGAETVRRIQNFTRVRSEATSEVLRARDLVEQAVELSRPRWKDDAQARGSSIHVTTRQIDGSIAIVGNGSEMREVLTNLVFNAVDAMPNGGRIALWAEERDGRVRFHVHDTGHGIPEDARRRIFEPFFTTRGPRNSGLGLAVSYGIVSRHGGAITVESEPGDTTFTIDMPSANVIGAPAGEEARAGVSNRLDRRVLVVDDDDAVRDVVADTLVDAGARVVAAASGREAVAALERERFDVVITDLGMPDLSGWEVARAARRIDPSLRVLLLTGWGETVTPDATNADARDAVHRILAKPIDLADLVDAVRES